VIEPDQLREVFASLGLYPENTAFVPKPFPGGASLDHIVVQELYPFGNDFSYPLEFVPKPANFVINEWNRLVDNSVDQYPQVFELFDDATWNSPVNPKSFD
jgi:hypothetical protein